MNCQHKKGITAYDGETWYYCSECNRDDIELCTTCRSPKTVQEETDRDGGRTIEIFCNCNTQTI